MKKNDYLERILSARVYDVAAETPLDMLNRSEGFFAFRPRDDGAGVLLVAKARTVTLTVSHLPPEDAARLSAAKQARFAVALADGSLLNGWATLELPEHHIHEWIKARGHRQSSGRA